MKLRTSGKELDKLFAFQAFIGLQEWSLMRFFNPVQVAFLRQRVISCTLQLSVGLDVRERGLHSYGGFCFLVMLGILAFTLTKIPGLTNALQVWKCGCET